MPNWTDNELYIIGREKDVQEVLDAIKGEPYANWRDKDTMVDNPISFERIIPYPKEWRELDEGSRNHDMEVRELREAMTDPTMSRDIPLEEREADFRAFMKEHNFTFTDGDNPIFFKDAYNEAPSEIDGCKSGYLWCAKMWGTKWDASDPEVIHALAIHNEEGYMDNEQEEPFATYKVGLQFLTAWSPPKPIIIALGKMFPKVGIYLKYWEGGMGFKGEFAIRGKQVMVDEGMEYNPHLDPDGFRGG